MSRPAEGQHRRPPDRPPTGAVQAVNRPAGRRHSGPRSSYGCRVWPGRPSCRTGSRRLPAAPTRPSTAVSPGCPIHASGEGSRRVRCRIPGATTTRADSRVPGRRYPGPVRSRPGRRSPTPMHRPMRFPAWGGSANCCRKPDPGRHREQHGWSPPHSPGCWWRVCWWRSACSAGRRRQGRRRFRPPTPLFRPPRNRRWAACSPRTTGRLRPGVRRRRNRRRVRRAGFPGAAFRPPASRPVP
jgi:hypothetical protein